MITTMICIHWTLLVVFTLPAIWVGVETHKENKKVNDGNMGSLIGGILITVLLIVLAVISGFTIAAIKAGAV